MVILGFVLNFLGGAILIYYGDRAVTAPDYDKIYYQKDLGYKDLKSFTAGKRTPLITKDMQKVLIPDYSKLEKSNAFVVLK